MLFPIAKKAYPQQKNLWEFYPIGYGESSSIKHPFNSISRMIRVCISVRDIAHRQQAFLATPFHFITSRAWGDHFKMTIHRCLESRSISLCTALTGLDDVWDFRPHWCKDFCCHHCLISSIVSVGRIVDPFVAFGIRMKEAFRRHDMILNHLPMIPPDLPFKKAS